MKKQNIIAVIILSISVVLAVISLIVLPETVVTQISISGSDASTMPKLAAVALPAALGIGGSLMSFSGKEDVRTNYKALFVAGVGVFCAVFTLIVNC